MKTQAYITIDSAKKLIKSTNGRLFSVEFVKNNGESTKRIARLGVKSRLKGGIKSFKDSDHNLKTYFDFNANDYRSFNWDRLVAFSFKGIRYNVSRSPQGMLKTNMKIKDMKIEM